MSSESKEMKSLNEFTHKISVFLNDKKSIFDGLDIDSDCAIALSVGAILGNAVRKCAKPGYDDEFLDNVLKAFKEGLLVLSKRAIKSSREK